MKMLNMFSEVTTEEQNLELGSVKSHLSQNVHKMYLEKKALLVTYHLTVSPVKSQI